MRISAICRRWKLLLITVVVNIIIIIILSSWQHQLPDNTPTTVVVTKRTPLIDSSLTLVFQDYDSLDNSVSGTIGEIAKELKNITILVVSHTIPYPPIALPDLKNVKLILLRNLPGSALNASRPEIHIHSNFVLFMPEGSSIDVHFLTKFRAFVSSFTSYPSDAYAIPVGRARLKCHGIRVSVRTWTLEIGESIQASKCGFVSGVHGLLLHQHHLGLLSNPFLPPTFTSLYIQLSLVYVKAVVSEEMYLKKVEGPKQDPQVIWQNKLIHRSKLKILYADMGIKKVVRENKKVDWYGCSKDSERCFDTVYNDMPEYLYYGRWAPPCCLKALGETAKYVFSILDKCKVRYWLEGGTLLGAARDGQIIPWDYDVDIGIYEEDLIKCTPLASLLQGNFVDDAGFSWEKSIEGDFYRVQYSETNHLHVDIFPFFPVNGTMTKRTWFKTHRQDTEFPERFLKPLARIKFVGVEASAPNHVREFLEYKFGKGVIETPKYPDAKIVV